MYHVFYPWLMKLEGSRQLLRFPADDLVLALHSIKTSPVGGRLDVGRNKILPVPGSSRRVPGTIIFESRNKVSDLYRGFRKRTSAW